MWTVPALLCLALPQGAAVPSHPAPIYSLPADGTWAEYRCRGTDARGKPITGTLRISSVGRQTVQTKMHRWLELKLQTKRSGETKTVWRKLLVAESAIGDGAPLVHGVAVCFARIGADGPVKQVPRAQMQSIISMGTWSEGAKLRLLKANDTIVIPPGRFVCTHVISTGSKPSRFVYHGWLSPKASFGWARFAVFENRSNRPLRLRFMAEFLRSGTGARSQVK